jgi:N6-adenosine-specific RNA methylase IME4
MSKFRIIVSDPPWSFGDELSMSKVKRGASANYDTLSISDLKDLQVQEIADEDAVLVLWCPSSLLSDGLAVMKAWGFRHTQTHIWVKTKKVPLRNLKRALLTAFKQVVAGQTTVTFGHLIQDILSHFDLEGSLDFGMGRLFRQTHEIALVGVRGKVYDHLENKSQRSVHFFPSTKHSVKPEALQDMLEKMFPQGERLEMFARRNRQGWTCVGLECPSTMGEDIRDSLNRLKS